MQKRFSVSWTQDVYAEDAREAAEKAWESMREPDSIANYFEVVDPDCVTVTKIDLGLP